MRQSAAYAVYLCAVLSFGGLGQALATPLEAFSDGGLESKASFVPTGGTGQARAHSETTHFVNTTVTGAPGPVRIDPFTRPGGGFFTPLAHL